MVLVARVEAVERVVGQHNGQRLRVDGDVGQRAVLVSLKLAGPNLERPRRALVLLLQGRSFDGLVRGPVALPVVSEGRRRKGVFKKENESKKR